MRTFPAKDTTKLLFESTMDFAAAGTTSQVLPPIKPAAAAPAHDEIRHSNEPVENEYYYGGENGYYGDDGDDYEGDETNARMYSVQDKQLLPYFPSSSDDNNQYKEQEAKANHIRRKNANNAPPPNVTATANIHLPPSFGKSTSQTASEISAAVAAATATANAAAAKTSGNTLKYFLDRLTLNERTQRDLMMETGRLHNEMGLSMHHQEGVAASMESMRLAIYNIQNLLYSVTAQMQVQKDGIVLLMENERVRDQQQQAMWSQMNQAIDEARQERQELRQDIQQLRTEVQTLRTDVARQQSETDSKFKNSSTTIELVYKQVTEQSSVALNDVRSYIKMLESKFGGSLNAADSNLMRVSKVLHDFSLGNKREEEVGREKLRADFIKTLETSFVKLNDEATARAEQLKKNYEAVALLIDEEQKKIDSLERISLVQMERRIASLMEREHQNESHLLQVGQAVARIKESLDINRNENRNWRDQVKRDAAEIQEELRREADDMRNSLMAEIRKMSRPMIVM